MYPQNLLLTVIGDLYVKNQLLAERLEKLTGLKNEEEGAGNAKTENRPEHS